MKPLLTAGLLCLFTGTVSAQPPTAPPPRAKLPDLDTHVYYPTRVGARLTYRTPGGDFIHVVTKVEEKDGARIVTVGSVGPGGTVVPTEKVLASVAGLAQLGSSAAGTPGWVTNDPPVESLRLRVEPGEKWEHTRGGVRLSFTAGGPETVRVPAGEFRTRTVRMVRTYADGRTEAVRYWYAPGVGVVKATSGGDEIVLKAFSPGE